MEKQGKFDGPQLLFTKVILGLLFVLNFSLALENNSENGEVLSRVPRELQSRELLESPSSLPLLLSLPLPPDASPSIGTQLRDLIRRARQIKFKSTYRELPLALQKAEERNRGTSKQLKELVHVGPSEPPSGESKALKALPPSSEVYFQPQVNDQSSRGKVLKHFGARKSNKKLKKLRKKIVGRKLVQAAKPEPQKVEHDAINFETSSTENVENTIINAGQVFKGKSLQSSRIGSPTRQNHSGGPNPEESFRNPYYIETSSNEISSYSFVPENSRIKPNSNVNENFQQESATPKPNRLPNTKSTKAQRQNVKFNKPKAIGGQLSKTTSIKAKTRRIPQKQTSQGKENRGKSLGFDSSSVRNDFLSLGVDQQRPTAFVSSTNGTPRSQGRPCEGASCGQSVKMDYGYSSAQNSMANLVKNPFSTAAAGSSFKRGKSLSDNSIRIPPPKTSGNKNNYPNLVSIPRTDFNCGNYRSGEYFADVDTNCQVFHVCFGGRQASFVCPVGTAFSQQLLVCDWWHKVQCGRNREKRELASYVPFDEARALSKPFTRII